MGLKIADTFMYSNFISSLRKDFKSYLVWENTVFSVVEVTTGKTKRQHEDQDTIFWSCILLITWAI